jgi:hypothetical protein
MTSVNDNFDVFFDEYKMSSKSDINNVSILFKNFEVYLNSILRLNEWFRRINNGKRVNEAAIECTITTLSKYMNIIYEYYAKIEKEEILNNIDINYYFIDVMTTAIIILYSYIYNFNIIEVDHHFLMDNTKINYQFILIIIMKRIISNCYVIDEVIKDEELLFKFKDIIYKTEPKCRRFVQSQMIVIIDFINKISVFYKIQPLNSRYVTIPKYTGICWFISFIVGICYSDKNKQLLLNKFDENETNYKKDELITELTANQIFTTLIYRIIKEITETTKTYDKIPEKTMNELNIYLKETPIKFLIKLLQDYNENKEQFPHEYSFINEYINKKEQENGSYKPYELEEYKKLGIFGIQPYNYFFLNILYKFLNINSLYLIKGKDGIYTYDTDNKDPDVLIVKNEKFNVQGIILLHINSSREAGYDINYTNIEEKITYTPELITYNNNNYELDYILYGNEEFNSWQNTGHAIVALNYNNEEYFYDSKYFIREYNYNNEKLRFPCPLLKNKWKDGFISNKSKFCIKKCFYAEINENSNLYRTTKNLSEDNMCYKGDDNTICCYVKVSEMTGGNNKYKKTNNKVEFTYKNRIYVRNIYLNSKNKKYIKLNNEYILLSK